VKLRDRARRVRAKSINESGKPDVCAGSGDAVGRRTRRFAVARALEECVEATVAEIDPTRIRNSTMPSSFSTSSAYASSANDPSMSGSAGTRSHRTGRGTGLHQLGGQLVAPASERSRFRVVAHVDARRADRRTATSSPLRP